MENNPKIKKLRKQIDDCDYDILVALYYRFFLVRQIGEIKKQLNLPIVNKSRYRYMVNNLIKNHAVGDLTEEFIKKLYKLIHEESIKIQK